MAFSFLLRLSIAAKTKINTNKKGTIDIRNEVFIACRNPELKLLG
jgi:hypothetical protein